MASIILTKNVLYLLSYVGAVFLLPYPTLANWLYQRYYSADHQLAKLAIPKDILEDPQITQPWEIGKLVSSIDVKLPYGYRDVCIILTLHDLRLRCRELCNLKD